MGLYDRFIKKYTVSENGCWEWVGYKTDKGYAQLYNKHGTSRANRISYSLYIGELSSIDEVCHRCDNPGCVSPFHLFKGSHADNMQDAKIKGRLPTLKHPSAKSYQMGCRCDGCKRARYEYIKSWEEMYPDKAESRKHKKLEWQRKNRSK